jgi:hypothetical protein
MNTGESDDLSLSEAVGAFCRDMVRLREELKEARLEIARLRKQLGDVELRSLRRRVSFHCHPDRGGDERVMQRVNALFDHLECFARSHDDEHS